jgi:hypothetical protein
MAANGWNEALADCRPRRGAMRNRLALEHAAAAIPGTHVKLGAG